ncbi:alpha/beta fold hydrolase [Nocardia sp. NPDC004711]
MRGTIDLNGASHAYQEVGNPDAPPIIVIHGGRGASCFGGDFSAFEPLGDHYRVTAFERRGLGESEVKEPLTVDQLVDDVEAFRASLFGSSPATVIGLSFGGQIALMHALRYQDSLSRLILIGATASHEFTERQLVEFDKRADRVPMATRDMVRRYMSGDMESETEMRLIKFAISRLYDEKNFSADAALKSALTSPCNLEVHRRYYMGTAYDVRDQLPSLHVPTLIMCGADDWVTPVSCSVEIHELIPGSTLNVVENNGHSIQHSAAEETLATIRSFLSS